MVLLTGLIFLLVILIAGASPKATLPFENPIAAPNPPSDLGKGLDGFDSPYIGHTGSWDGKGGAMFGGSKDPNIGHGSVDGLAMDIHVRLLEGDGTKRPGGSQ